MLIFILLRSYIYDLEIYYVSFMKLYERLEKLKANSNNSCHLNTSVLVDLVPSSKDTAALTLGPGGNIVKTNMLISLIKSRQGSFSFVNTDLVLNEDDISCLVTSNPQKKLFFKH